MAETTGSATPRAGGGSKARPAVYAGDSPWQNRKGNTNHRAVFRAGLFGLFIDVVLVMAALRGVLAVVAELGQLVIEGLDRGFLLTKDFLYQLVAMGFERLLLGEEFIDRIVGHVDYDAIAGLPAGGMDGGARLSRTISVFGGRVLTEQQPEEV